MTGHMRQHLSSLRQRSRARVGQQEKLHGLIPGTFPKFLSVAGQVLGIHPCAHRVWPLSYPYSPHHADSLGVP